MSLKGLIDNQTIIIDDHKRGNGEQKNWDDPAAEVHIDKTTDYSIEGKRQKVRIRIPINSDRELSIENRRKQELNNIPSQLRKEIRNAFEDKKTRERFIKDLIEILKGFDTALSSKQRVQQILNKLSKHFELEWTNEIIATYTSDILVLYSQSYKNVKGMEYFISVDNQKIKIGRKDRFVRHQRGIK